MRIKQFSLLVGIALGLFLIFLSGAAYQELKLSGSLVVWQNRMYHSSLSGFSDKGECYLAVTNCYSGQTEVFLISEKLRQQFTDKTRPIGRFDSLTFFGPGPVDFDRKQ